MSTTDVPPTTDERFREVAAILAAGLLRLRSRLPLAATSDMAGKHADPQNSSESGGNSLAFSAPPRTNPHPG